MLYQNNGYIDIPWVLSHGMSYNFILGGRGTGKTYTTLKNVLVDNPRKFGFMRRTQTQIEIVSNPEFSPFEPINKDFNTEVYCFSATKNTYAIKHGVFNENGRLVPDGETLGYMFALSTIANLRGFYAEDIQVLIYDEFIPERHEKRIKNEGIALMNAYETMNRNRELKGKNPLQLIALTNANDASADVLISFGITKKVSDMFLHGKEVSILRDRGIALFNLSNSPISKAKKETALYKASTDTQFEKMAIENQFNNLTGRYIIPQKLNEYKPMVTHLGFTIYKHKSNKNYYVTSKRTGTPYLYSEDDIDRKRFKNTYKALWFNYICGHVFFEDALCEVLFNRAFE